MKRLAAIVRKEPTLVEWLRSGLWRSGFDRGSLGRAQGYLDFVSVVDTEHVPGESVSCAARVEGNSATPYRSHVTFVRTSRGWFLDALCSCPVGLYCKHDAAIILAMLEDVSPPPPSAPAMVKVPMLEPGILDWLGEMGSGFSSAEGGKKPSKANEARFLAFCLRDERYSLAGRRTWYLSMRVGLRKRDGVTIQETMANADPSNPPKYMAREDFIPASLYHQLKRRTGAWNELRCEGKGWEEMLDAMLATGRFYLWDSRRAEWRNAAQGPEIGVKPGWTSEKDGAMRPVLEFADDHPRSVLPLVPPYYVDEETGEIGRLAGGLSPGLLTSWLKGPKVAPSQVDLLSARLSEMSAELPAPKPMETVELPAVAPVPHLRIIRKGIFSYGSSSSVIAAELRFRYGAGPLLEPLAASGGGASHSEVQEGKIRIQPRSDKAEKAARSFLISSGFLPLPEVLPASLRDAGAASTYLLAGTDPHDKDAWLDFVERKGKAALVDAGWVVEVTRESGLIVRDAGELFAELEESPDHGIDWFRFDAAFELDGKRVTLIPIIASAIRMNLPTADSPDLPEHFMFPAGDLEDGMIRFPAKRLLEFVDQVRHLFQGNAAGDGPVRIDRLAAAGIADSFAMDDSGTLRALAELSRNLRDIKGLPEVAVPDGVHADLREYQREGFRWLRFLADHGLNGILADDMGLGKTLQTLAHIAAEKERGGGLPSLVIAPTSVVPNWLAEAGKFTPHLTVIVLHGKERAALFSGMESADLVITSYALAHRDIEVLAAREWDLCVLDEAQYIKNSKAVTTRSIRRLKARQRLCLSGTPMENHLGELWSLMHFLMPGFLGDENHFNSAFRRPIERDRSSGVQRALNRRIAPLVLRRTKDQVARDLPAKTEILHTIALSKKQTDLYESVRAAMDRRVRDAIAEKGLAKSHIIVLDALLKLRQICCHPPLLKTPASEKADSAKLDFLMDDLLPTLVEEGRRILLFSSFTTMLAEIGKRLQKLEVPFLTLTGSTRNRAELVGEFQEGRIPVFLISLKAGGTGLNLTAADTVIHYDPWWNPAAENQATDRAHRIGQVKPVFVHKLVCGGSVEERIIELQKHKAALVQALLEEETAKLKIDTETLSHLLAPLA